MELDREFDGVDLQDDDMGVFEHQMRSAVSQNQPYLMFVWLPEVRLYAIASRLHIFIGRSYR